MQKHRILTSVVVVLTVLLAGGTALYWSEVAWISVQFTDTPEAYVEFLDSHPDSRHQVQAKRRLDELEWRHATRFGGVLGYRRYLEWLPDGEHVEAARQGLDDATWREALAEGTDASIGEYLSAYPAGRNVAQAHLELERIAWDVAVLADTRVAFVEFLERFPSGAFQEEARAQVQAEAYWAAYQSGEVEPLLAFIESNPPQALLEDAYDQLDDLYWDRASREGTLEALARFLEQSHGDEHRADALYQLEELTWVAVRRERTRARAESYLEEFPAGQYYDDVEEILAEIALAEALEEGTAEAVQDYVSAHPESVETGNVPSTLESSLWSQAEELDSIQAYENYLRHFADGVHAAAAKRALEGRSATLLLSLGLIEVDVVSAKPGTVELEVRFASQAPEAPTASTSESLPTGVTVDLVRGTLLRPLAGGGSSLLVVEDGRARVGVGRSRRVVLEAVCLEDARIASGADYGLESGEDALPADLSGVLFNNSASIDKRQIAAWIALGDATLAEFREQRFAPPDPFPFEIVAEAMKLLDAHGIDLTRRRIWADRRALSAAVPSGRLQEWLARPATVEDAIRFGTPEQLQRELEAGGSPHRIETGTEEALDPLRLAIELDKPNHGRVLIAAGASVNTGRSGTPPLTMAVQRRSVTWVRQLLEAGAVPNRTRSPHNAFALAAESNQVELLRLLLAAGAHVDGVDTDDEPLRRAIVAGHAEAVAFLIEHGARWDLGTESPDAAMDLAAFRSAELLNLLYELGGSETIFSAVALDDLEGIERGLGGGASLERPGLDGQRPLHLACLRRSPAALDRLLSHGADLGSRTAEGLEPLHVATRIGWKEGVRTLVRAGANVNGIGGRGTALQLALRAADEELLALLLELGADATLAAPGDPSPLDEARGLAAGDSARFGGIVQRLITASSL